MTGNFMSDWLTLWLAFVVATAPFGMFLGAVRMIVGRDPPKRNGCAIAILAMSWLLLIAAPFIGYWCFQTFVVEWRA